MNNFSAGFTAGLLYVVALCVWPNVVLPATLAPYAAVLFVVELIG